MLPGPESLEDQTDGDPPFTRQRINVPKVAGQNGLPVVEEPDE